MRSSEKPNVGYMRQLSAEGVLGLAPSLVLATEGSGPKETIAVLEKRGGSLRHGAGPHTGESILDKIALIADAVGVPERGACLATNVRRDLAALSDIRAGINKPARVLFILSFMNGRPMVAGSGTAADGIIKLAGAINAAGDFQGYKIVSDEAIVAAKPDAILSMVRQDFKLTPEEVFGHPAFSATPAAASKALIGMDGLYLLGFGPRTARGGARSRASPLSLPVGRTDAVREAGRHANLRVMTAIPVRRTAGSASRALPRPGAMLALGVLAILLIVVAVVSSTVGPAGIPLQRLAAAIGLTQGGADLVRDQLVLWSVRLPRIVMAAMVGTMLAVAGAVMQGLFRNPLADPALIGVSSGAAFAAASTIVMTNGSRRSRRCCLSIFSRSPLSSAR